MKLLPSVEPRWLLHVIGILFVGAGCIVFVMGCRTYHIVIKKLEKEGLRGIPSAPMGGVDFCMVAGDNTRTRPYHYGLIRCYFENFQGA